MKNYKIALKPEGWHLRDLKIEWFLCLKDKMKFKRLN